MLRFSIQLGAGRPWDLRHQPTGRKLAVGCQHQLRPKLKLHAQGQAILFDGVQACA